MKNSKKTLNAILMIFCLTFFYSIAYVYISEKLTM